MWWLLYGLIVGAGVMHLIYWVQDAGIKIGWYVWLIGALAILLGTLTVQHFLASYKERELTAAWMGVLVMGSPALILAGISAWFFIAS